jgi:hypothetical protein
MTFVFTSLRALAAPAVAPANPDGNLQVNQIQQAKLCRLIRYVQKEDTLLRVLSAMAVLLLFAYVYVAVETIPLHPSSSSTWQFPCLPGTSSYAACFSEAVIKLEQVPLPTAWTSLPLQRAFQVKRGFCPFGPLFAGRVLLCGVFVLF